jgi:hypothetical protein
MKYRDATYSEETQDALCELLAWLTVQPLWNEGMSARRVYALTEVIERWDANEATEYEDGF